MPNVELKCDVKSSEKILPKIQRMASTNPLLLELSRPEILDDSEKQLKLLNCTKNQLKNNLLDVKEVISPLVKLVASNNSSVKVKRIFLKIMHSNILFLDCCM